MRKRGQVTIFMIIGLILLLSVSIFFYYSSTVGELEKAAIPTAVDQASVQSYVQSCMESIAQETIQILAAQGGMYEPILYTEHYGDNINYWCTGEGTNQCVNTLFTRQDFESQIVYSVRQDLPNCLDLGAFEKQGYYVKEGTLDGTAQMSSEKVHLEMSYPITLQKREQEITVETFYVDIETPLGELFSIGQHILNQEATAQFFDKSAWQKDHANVKVTKQRPYPGIIYELTKQDITLQFAVQGIDTVSTPGEILLGAPEPKYGCCYVEGACFANTPSTVCEQKKGSYETAPCACETPQELEEPISECEDGICNRCGTYEHGESWCEYEKEVGEGKDTVGSRHYVYSCFDGETILEPCRDYREEICVQKRESGESSAVCRPNRWQDCSACTDENCCTNTADRDCHWNEEATTCTPYVPPGFRFWEFNGIEICSLANSEETCNGLSCPEESVTNAATTCYMQGDCGNYVNTQKVLTERAFFSSNIKYEPDEDIYDVKNKPTPISDLPFTISVQKQITGTPVATAADIFLEMLAATYNFVNQWVDVTVPNYLNPLTPSPKIAMVEVSFCTPWQAPPGGDACDKCEGEFPCSEYKCKSLGKRCIYEEIDGVPTCSQMQQKKAEPFGIKIDAPQHKLEKTTLSIENMTYNGFVVEEKLMPYELFTLDVETDAQTICRLDYTPQTPEMDPPMFFLGEAKFSTNHSMTLRVPPTVSIPEKLKDGLNLTTSEEIVDAILEPKDLLESYEESFPAVFSVYKTVTGEDLEDELDPYVDEILDFMDEVEDSYDFYRNTSITILDKVENDGYYLFVSCEDRYGNMQEEEVFIDIEIDMEAVDKNPPKILAFSPENDGFVATHTEVETIFMYTNEPASCKYDFEDNEYEDLEYTWSCANDPYDLVPTAGGSYECRTTIPIVEETVLYTMCVDMPNNVEEYLIDINAANTTAITSEIYSDYVPVGSSPEDFEDNIIVEEYNTSVAIGMSSYLLSDTHTTVFETAKENTTVTVYLEEERNCVVEADETQDMICEPSSDYALGSYACSSELTITANTSLTILCSLEDNKQNMQEESTVYTLSKTIPLEITSISPGNEDEVETETAMTVKTSESKDISCGYAPYGSLEYVQMNEVPETGFTAVLKNLNQGYVTYEVECQDGYGNVAQGVTTFYVVG